MTRRKSPVRAPARKPTPEPAQVHDALPSVVDFQVSGEARDFLAPGSGHIDAMGLRITEGLVADMVKRSPEAVRIVGLLETDPGLRGSVAAYIATLGEMKKAEEAAGREWDPVIQVGGRAGGKMAAVVSQLGVTPFSDLEPIWMERLTTMSAAAGKTPAAYLETLLRRAWCSMPLEKRGGP